MTLAFLITLLVVFTCSYVTYFGLIAKPDWSVYAYLIIWLAIPKAFRLFYISGGAYDFPEGLTVFNIIEAVAVCGMVVALIRHRKSQSSEKTKALRRFAWLFLITGTASFIISFGFLSLIFSSHLDELWTYLEWHTELQSRILPFTTIVFGVVFLYACITFIRQKSQVETILLLFLLVGVGLGIESILFYYLPSFYPLPILTPLAAWSVQQAGGRFMSLIFSSYDQVGVFSIISLACCVYFSQARKNKLFLLLLPLVFLPILAGYQRSVLVGAFVALAFVYWNSSSGRKRIAFISIAAFALLTIYVLDTDLMVLNKIATNLGSAERADYLSTESLDARFGLQIRAMDVFVRAFPFGVGPGMVPTAMNSPISHSLLGYEIPQVSDYSASIYGQLATGFRTTNSHNIFLEFIVEDGLLGIVLLSMFFYLVIRNFRLWVKNSRSVPRDDAFFAQACVYAIFVGIGVHGMFESTYFPFSMYFMFLYFTFLPKLSTEPVHGDLSPTKTSPVRLVRREVLVPNPFHAR
jgi:O-antigen ligase